MHAFILAALLAASPPGQGDALELVDDRGEAIHGALRVCFVQGLETDCHELEDAASSPVALQEFDLLRVEGPLHGPVTARPGELTEDHTLLVVPRKARLRIAGLPEEPATLSLYPVDDPDGRHPSFRFDLEAAEGLRELHVPAGEHLASIARRSAAPDLHAFAVPPGGDLSIRYRERTGWSLALRAVDPESGEPVSGAGVELSPPPGGSEEPLALPTAKTGSLGFALFSGLEPPMVHATVRHGDFVDTEVLGLSASPGTFDLHHSRLERGGTVEVRVTIDGEPATEAVCRIVESAGTDAEMNIVIETLDEEPVDPSGTCRLERVAAGTSFLRVVPDRGSSSAVVDRRVQVVEDETIRMTLDLSPIRLSGTVYRGDEPAGTGYVVSMDLLRAEGPTGTRDPALVVSTGESGGYEATLWTPGEYYVHLSGPGDSGLGTERAYLDQPTEEIDFHVSTRTVHGRVVDRDGEPVTDAVVSITWNRRSHSRTFSGGAGEFSVELPSDDGSLLLYARRPWEPPSEEVTLTIAPGVPIPDVTLVISEGDRSVGRLLTSGGVPVAGATVWSYKQADTGVPLITGRTSTDSEGGFDLPLSPDGPTLLYATGLGCPLTLAAVAPGSADGTTIDLRCADQPSAVRLRMLDAEGDGMAGQSLILRAGDLVIPAEVLEAHLVTLGLPSESDRQGRLVLAGMAPGTYDLYLRASSNEFTVAQGMRHGFVVSTSLAPRTATDLEIVVDEVQ